MFSAKIAQNLKMFFAKNAQNLKMFFAKNAQNLKMFGFGCTACNKWTREKDILVGDLELILQTTYGLLNHL